MGSQLERNRTTFFAALRKKGGSVEGRNNSELCQKLGLGSMRGNNFSITVTHLLAQGEVLRAEEPREVDGREETIVTLSLPECKVAADQPTESVVVGNNTNPGPKKKGRKTTRGSRPRRR